MLVKELDSFIPHDKLAKAGKEAEAQMSFYLRRAFADSKSIYVFNDLRLKNEGDTAQIDHLVFHQHGIVIIESKSVTSRVAINDQQEWIRWFNNTPQGMASPILQARRQGEFLKKYLNQNADILLNKFLGLQTYFGSMSIDVLVAISDSGIINRPKTISLGEVCKADQICDRVWRLLDKQQKESSVFNLNSTGRSFNKDEVDKIVMFLLKEHKPLLHDNAPADRHNFKISSSDKQVVQAKTESHSKTKPIIFKPSKAIASKYLCRQCNKTNLSVMYGRYNYYFKCLECDSNTPINIICRTCNNKNKIHKNGNQFYAKCESCNISDLFYINRAT